MDFGHIKDGVVGEQLAEVIGSVSLPVIVDFPSQLFARHADELVEEESVRDEASGVEDGYQVVDVALDSFRHSGILDLHRQLGGNKEERRKICH